MAVNVVEIQIISADLCDLQENLPNTYIEIKWNEGPEVKRTEIVYNTFNPNYEELDDQLSWDHEPKEGDVLHILIKFVSNSTYKSQIKWLTVAMPSLETRDKLNWDWRETRKIEEKPTIDQ